MNEIEMMRDLLKKLTALDRTIGRVSGALKKANAPVRYEYKTFGQTSQINQYAAIGYRLHSITPEDGTLCIVMEREAPAEELEDDIFALTESAQGK